MKHKVAELEGALLDAAVAHAEGCGYPRSAISPIVERAMPSSLRMDGDPIIERERISVEPWADRPEDAAEAWAACVGHPVESLRAPSSVGPTPLIAAMRAFVSSKFGEEVEMP